MPSLDDWEKEWTENSQRSVEPKLLTAVLDQGLQKSLAHLTQEESLRKIQRHQAGDCGDVCMEDRLAND